MNNEPELESSPLCQSISSGGKTVEVHIYRLGGGLWTLEIEDKHGNSTVWEDEFKTDSAALLEAKKSILEETINTFIAPEDGKSSKEECVNGLEVTASMVVWTKWRAFPDPREGELLVAPFGPGVYVLRNGKTGEFVLFGKGNNCASRMSSLLPKPLGCGTRSNSSKRDYVLDNIKDIEYQCSSCDSEAHSIEVEIAAEKAHIYLYPT